MHLQLLTQDNDIPFDHVRKLLKVGSSRSRNETCELIAQNYMLNLDGVTARKNWPSSYRFTQVNQRNS